MANICFSIETRADSTITRNNMSPDVIPTQDGGFFVFWVAQLSNYDIYAQKFSKSHNKVGGEILIANTNAKTSSRVRATRLTNGKIVVTYHIITNTVRNWAFKILDESLTFTSMETTLNTVNTGRFAFDTCSLTGARFAIIISFFNINGDTDSGVIIYNGDGTLIKYIDISVIQGNQGNFGESCVGLSNGNFFLAWTSDLQDGSGLGLYSRIYDSNYNLIKSDFQINLTTSGNQQFPTFANNAKDEVIICWESNQSSVFNPYCKIYDSNGNILKEEIIITNNAGSNQRYPRALRSDQNNFIICWFGTANGNSLVGQCSLIDDQGNFLYKDHNIYQTGINKNNLAVAQIYNSQYVIAGESNYNGTLGIYFDSYYNYQLANTIFINDQKQPYVNRLNNGGFIITWTCVNSCENGNGTRAQFFDKDGKKVGNELQVNQFTDNDQDKCKSVTLSNNNIFLFWESKGQDKFTADLINTGIFGKIISQDGVVVKNEFLLNSSVENTQYQANMIANQNGFSVLTYSSKHYRCDTFGCSFTVWAKFFNNDGSVKLNEYMINTRTSGNQDNMFACFLKDNRILFVWTSDSDQDGNGIGIFGRISDINGIFPNTTEFQINKTTIGDQINPSCTALNFNRFVVVYESGTDVLGRIFNSDFTVFKDEFRINTYITGIQQNSYIYGLSDGRFVVGWESFGQDESLLGVYYQVFDSVGNSSGTEIQGNLFTFQDQKEISITQLISGAVAIAFTSYGDSDGTGVYFEFIIYCQDGRFVDSENQNRCSLCNSKCGTCNNKSTCLTCGLNYYALENTNTCVSQCPNGYLNTPVNNICKICSSLCKTCNMTFDNCSSCNTGYNLALNSTNTYTCLNSFVGYYLDNVLNIYVKCDVSCSTCSTSPMNCQSCNTSGNYYPKIDASNSCFLKTSSPNGYFFNSISNKHELCDISCLTCLNSATNCQTCNNSGGYYNTDASPNSCKNSPPTGYFLDQILKKYVNTCDVSCSTCSTTSTNCQTCNLKAYYYQKVDSVGVCIYYADAPNGYFYSSTSKNIDICDISCLTCYNGAAKCLICNTAKGYYNTDKNPNACSNTIPSGYILDSSLGKYVSSCDVSCSTCATTTINCTQCNTSGNYYPKVDASNSCFLKTSSPSGYYFNSNTNKHEKCDISCLTCLNSVTNCQTCNNPGGYYNTDASPNSCINVIPSGFFLD